MSRDIAAGFQRGDFKLSPTLAEMVKAGEFDSANTMGTMAPVARAALDWVPDLRALIELLRQPLTTSHLDTLMREARERTLAIAKNETLPTPIRHAACDVYDRASTTGADLNKVTQKLEVLERELAAQGEEIKRLNRRVGKISREEAVTDAKQTCTHLMAVIKSGAEVLGQFDSHLGDNTEFELVGTWLAKFFNGARSGGKEEPALAVKPNGEKYALDTLSRWLNDDPSNPKPGTKQKRGMYAGDEFLELIERWHSAGLRKLESEGASVRKVA